MNNQFATQFLLQELDEYDSLRNILQDLGAAEDSIELLIDGVKHGLITPEKAIKITKLSIHGVHETSSVGGGSTTGASFTGGTGEQMATNRAFKKKYQEDAPILAGGKSDISTYTNDGFKKVEESRAYTQFKREATLRPKSEQLHQAAKMIQHKLQEVDKLLEFTAQMRQELSEGEETVEYKHNTKKIFEKVHNKVVEVYTKVKGLK